LGTNAITFHLPDKEKQSILFGIHINVSVPAGGYSKHKKISMESMALVDTGATGSCISRRLAENAQY
jgi:predicted aspartyl protease